MSYELLFAYDLQVTFIARVTSYCLLQEYELLFAYELCVTVYCTSYELLFNHELKIKTIYGDEVTIKNYFFRSFFDKEIYIYKSFMYHIKLVIPLERFRIVTHSLAASFSIKICLDKTNNIF